MHAITYATRVLAFCLLSVLPVQGWGAEQTEGGTTAQQQVAQGIALYKQRCGVCHDVPSRSLDDAPRLAGRAFAHKWLTRPEALFLKIRYAMPQDNPGTLSDENAKALVAALSSGQISGKAPVK
ncbi:c-type cytochrome [Acetobacter orleanensis]|uniref:Cytochrome c domain-containing protein n=1 Tax=Acetobacter orleanensis TaxID=104099 RepID=A0A4Y3TLL9_9PROT|nr:cytochrome c [Acetobacter orleanensis]KXV62674.1 hypothetical protein AD949_09365 [Acetobacter orleanensis]PCD79186.1 hypothetical protein CO710_07865 [Acetobacter orleanensis]GAN68625.1 hypothetical protein Abol_020_068 [Acetobacter orleanensis JCM 7639]GBR27770.1 hypothetical protein AA0473_1532 [Acetobacter orleanensis NRIC 0473]GEB83256.1 hypothetical protein AOR01nite_17330 [Acetobacter orleanensis]